MGFEQVDGLWYRELGKLRKKDRPEDFLEIESDNGLTPATLVCVTSNSVRLEFVQMSPYSYVCSGFASTSEDPTMKD